jgi:hypothetical protein
MKQSESLNFMGTFDQFTKTALTQSLNVIGELATIGGNQFTASFDESEMSVSRNPYGDEDEVTTVATCLKSALSNKPEINETLTRVATSTTYVILEVQEDVSSYEITLRAKNG